MTTKKFAVRIININSHRQTEKNGDEVFLRMRGEKIWPTKVKYASMLGKSATNVDHSIDVQLGSQIELELWEYDNFFDDLLGKFTLTATEAGGPYVCDMQAHDAYAKYSLVWEVVRLNMLKN